MTTLLVTGGAGFIGSAVIRYLIQNTDVRVVNIDKLTYAGNLESLAEVELNPRYQFEKVEIADAREIHRIFEQYPPDAVMHLAAESHVDRSIDGPAPFIHTNILGTYTLLEESLRYWKRLRGAERERFRFHHISTDEVFGSLGKEGLFTEASPYRPNSPYAASKASSDHLVRAWHRTYGLPVIVTNCSNNYGPYQFPEKLIPLTILHALEEKPLPVYGDGQHVRDWLYVEDHVRALHQVITCGDVGETYNIGGYNEKTNLDVIHAICALLDEKTPRAGQKSYKNLIGFVEDRPGHDRRYAIDARKIEQVLDWKPSETFESGLRKTVAWYIDHKEWSDRIRDGRYRGERLGVGIR